MCVGQATPAHWIAELEARTTPTTPRAAAGVTSPLIDRCSGVGDSSAAFSKDSLDVSNNFSPEKTTPTPVTEPPTPQHAEQPEPLPTTTTTTTTTTVAPSQDIDNEDAKVLEPLAFTIDFGESKKKETPKRFAERLTPASKRSQGGTSRSADDKKVRLT